MSTTYHFKTTNQTLMSSSFRRILRCIAITLLLAFLLPFLTFATKPKMLLFSIAPEWHGKTVCDNGNGYDPSVIVAPSMSYSGDSVNEPSYNYRWEQKDGASWVTVSTGEGVTFVPAFNPAVIYNTDTKSKKVAWRVIVTDVSNNFQIVASDEYSLTLLPTIKAVSSVSGPKGNKQKYAIELTVTGGSEAKSFLWSTFDTDGKRSLLEEKGEVLEGVSAGKYQVEITDKVCAPFIYKINTDKNQTEKSQ